MEVASLPRNGRIGVPHSRRLLSAFGDERLVEQIRRGNEVAFEVVFDRHHRGILSFCRHMLSSREEAEDAVQHTFIAAYNDLVSSDKPIKLKAWLYTIARNRCLSVLRARREQASDEIEISTAGLVADVQQRADVKELLADMRELPGDQRAALVLSELGDLSHAEIGEVVGCPAVKVKSLVFQARTALIESRDARAIACEEIREQLATLRGGALRRAPLRRHLKHCTGCAEFREEVRRQRAAMAMVLPVVPSVGLKAAVVGAIGGIGGGGGAAAAGGLTAATSGGITAMAAGGGSAVVMGATSTAAKVLVVAALGAGMAGGGAVIVEDDGRARSPLRDFGWNGDRAGGAPAPRTDARGGQGDRDAATSLVPGAADADARFGVSKEALDGDLAVAVKGDDDLAFAASGGGDGSSGSGLGAGVDDDSAEGDRRDGRPRGNGRGRHRGRGRGHGRGGGRGHGGGRGNGGGRGQDRASTPPPQSGGGGGGPGRGHERASTPRPPRDGSGPRVPKPEDRPLGLP